MQRMVRRPGAMHVARIKSSHVDKAGQRRDYQSVYLHRSFRDGGKVKTSNWRTCPHCPTRRSARSRRYSRVRRWCRPPTRCGSNHPCRTGTSRQCTPWRIRWACPPCWGRRAGPATWRCADRVAGADAGFEAVHADRVGQHHPRGRSGVTGAATDEVYAAMDWLTTAKTPSKSSWRHGIWTPR